MISKEKEESVILKLKKENKFSFNIELENDPLLKLDRVEKGDIDGVTSIRLYLIDNSPNAYGIRAEIASTYYCDKTKDRSIFTLKSSCKINETKFVEKFNSELNVLRYKYKSMFLGNYRNGNRKRLTIQEAIKFSNHIITKFKLSM